MDGAASRRARPALVALVADDGRTRLRRRLLRPRRSWRFVKPARHGRLSGLGYSSSSARASNTSTSMSSSSSSSSTSACSTVGSEARRCLRLRLTAARRALAFFTTGASIALAADLRVGTSTVGRAVRRGGGEWLRSHASRFSRHASTRSSSSTLVGDAR